MEALSGLKESSYAFSSQAIREQLLRLGKADIDSTLADQRTRAYYRREGDFLWIDRYGVDSRADTLLALLRQDVPAMGFSLEAFGVQNIEADIARIRQLDFGEGSDGANGLMARVEYRLTKAYMRYAIGQRYGFFNPLYYLNRLDATETDSTGRALGYRRLFDMDILRPDSVFYVRLLASVTHDSLGPFVREGLPRGEEYRRLLGQLAGAEGARRKLLLCNMEQLRWRLRKPLSRSGKYVVVNIPAFHLYAYGGDSLLDMRVGCGSVKTKTPLLTSEIERMDVNPQWHIPMSIIKNDVVRHAGDASYFARHRYIIVERSTGKQLDASEVSQSMLLSGAYRVSQEGGEGNALGRIVFRFANSFSVFLHDTSSRDFFSRNHRGVSHGCVRIQKPFDFALFLLGDRDEWFQDKLRISMGMPPATERGQKYAEAHPDNFSLVGSQAVKPRVPLAIVYRTYYPDATGAYRQWPDVYGYDEVMWQRLKCYL